MRGEAAASRSVSSRTSAPRRYQYLLYGSIAGGVKQQMERGCGDLIFR